MKVGQQVFLQDIGWGEIIDSELIFHPIHSVITLITVRMENGEEVTCNTSIVFPINEEVKELVL